MHVLSPSQEIHTSGILWTYEDRISYSAPTFSLSLSRRTALTFSPTLGIHEARSKGCVFDNLSYTYVQPACHHQELMESFRARSNITYYTSHDLSAESQIFQEEIYAGDWPEAISTKEQHPVHCDFMLSKLHESLLKHLPLDNKVMSSIIRSIVDRC